MRRSHNRQALDESASAVEFSRAGRAAKFLRLQTRLRPRIVVVLGSGLGGCAEVLLHPDVVSCARIPHFAVSRTAGHAGRLLIGGVQGVPVAVLQGRLHAYEGFSPAEIVFPLRVLARLGARTAILTNASGGIRPLFSRGSLVLIRDQINLLAASPLTGADCGAFGPRFVDMSCPFSERLRKAAKAAARRLKISLREGVYAGLWGPQFETPAEVGYLRSIGADIVGLSTIFEVIAARQMKMNVLGISCVTNSAGGSDGRTVTHDAVLHASEAAAGKLSSLLRELIPFIANLDGQL